MRRLHRKVNIVVVIAKADTLTLQEVKNIKEVVLNDIEANGLQIYQFPDCDSDEDEAFKQQVSFNSWTSKDFKIELRVSF